MDKDVIYSKIDRLSRCIDRITIKIPNSPALLKSDLDLQDIIVLNLERAVQTSVDLGLHIISSLEETLSPTSMREVFEILHHRGILSEPVSKSMGKSVGFRNTAVHTYQAIDFDIVYAIATVHLDDFRHFAEEIVAFLERQTIHRG